MKPLHCLASVLVIAAASVPLGPAVFADASPVPGFTIENHQKLVTVKDGTGKPLFAQVVSSPNVKIVDASLGKNLSRLSLQNPAGKTLWSRTSNRPFMDVNVNGEWSEVLEKIPDVIKRATESLDIKKDTSPKMSFDSVEVVVGPDDRAVSFGGGFASKNGRHHFVANLIKNGVAIRVDTKYFLVILSPPAVAQAPAH